VSLCHDLEALLSERASGEVAAADQARLDAHVPACKTCQARLASYEEVLDLARLPSPMAVPPGLAAGFLLNPDMSRSTLGRLRVKQRRHRVAFAGTFGMAAAAALAVAFSLHLMPSRMLVPGSSEPSVAANWEPDVEGALEVSGVDEADSQDDIGSGDTEMALLDPSDLP